MYIADTKYNGCLPLLVSCEMDEFANIGEVPSFNEILSVVRSYNIRICIVLQGISQLKAIYEKHTKLSSVTVIFLLSWGQRIRIHLTMFPLNSIKLPFVVTAEVLIVVCQTAEVVKIPKRILKDLCSILTKSKGN